MLLIILALNIVSIHFIYNIPIPPHGYSLAIILSKYGACYEFCLIRYQEHMRDDK